MDPYLLLEKTKRLLYDEASKAGRSVLMRKLAGPPLSSGTLGPDDEKIAREQLKARESWFDPAPVKDYENAFADWNGSAHAFSFMGARVALSSCVHALGLKPGDEVIVPGYTCVVVPNAFHYAGVKVIYADIELETYGLNASALRAKITPDTKAVLLHHLYGLVCRDYEEIIAIAHERGLFVIEDCAQATGAKYKGRNVGNLGDVAIYSTERSKVFSTVEGGFATCNDPTFAQRLEEYRGMAPYPDVFRIEKELYNVIIDYNVDVSPERWWKGRLVGLALRNKVVVSTVREEENGVRPRHYGCRLPAPLAVIGLNQLAKVGRYNQERREVAREWDNWCDKAGYEKPLVVENSVPVFLRYPLLVEPEKKKDTLWGYRELGVKLGVWYKSNLHPVTSKVEGCPYADEAVRRCINFPTIRERS